MAEKKGELDFKGVVEKYPDYPSIAIRKIDVAFRGVNLTERAVERAREEGAVYDAAGDLGEETPRLSIGGALFRDGTRIRAFDLIDIGGIRPARLQRKGSPYTLDVVDGKVWLLDAEEPVEEVFFVPIPAYYGKKTSRGTPMTKVVQGNIDVLHVNVFGYCYFWQQKIACQYCGSIQGMYAPDSRAPGDLEDIHETVNEALKENGRWTSFALVSGSDPRGDVPYDKEVNEYVRVLKTLRRSFGKGKNYTVRLVSSAVPKEQQVRLKEAGVTAVEPHIEVWDKKLFEIICPGKTKYFGWQYWVDSAIAAVDVFGRGNVCSQIVAGAELAQPHGFKCVDKALASDFEGAEFFAKHGVTTSANLYRHAKGSVFYEQQQKHPSLEYCVRLTKGLHEIRRKYRLGVDCNDYRRCGIHPDTDLARLFNHEVTAEPIAVDA